MFRRGGDIEGRRGVGKGGGFVGKERADESRKHMSNKEGGAKTRGEERHVINKIRK